MRASALTQLRKVRLGLKQPENDLAHRPAGSGSSCRLRFKLMYARQLLDELSRYLKQYQDKQSLRSELSPIVPLGVAAPVSEDRCAIEGPRAFQRYHRLSLQHSN